MTLTSKKVYFIMLGVLGLLIIGNIAAVLFANKLIGSSSNKLLSLRVDSEVLDQQQTALIKAQNDIAKYTDLDNIAKTIVPQDKDQALAVREITNIASKVGIPILSVTFPASNLGQSSAASNASSGSSSGSGGSATTGVSASKTGLTQVQPVPGLLNVYQLQITIQTDPAQPVSYSKMIQFLHQIELNRRTSQITGMTVTPDVNNRNNVAFSVIVNEYLKP